MDKLKKDKTTMVQTATVKEVIEILSHVEDKDLPLVFVTKHVKVEDIRDGIVYSGNPNQTAYKFDEPEEIHLELLPMRD